MENSKSDLNQNLLNATEMQAYQTSQNEVSGFSKSNKNPKIVVVPSPVSLKPQQKINSPMQIPLNEPQKQVNDTENKPPIYTISDEPSLKVKYLMSLLDSFESKYQENAGKALILISVILFAILACMKDYLLPDLPHIEVIFIIFLVAFITNYWYIDGAHMKPFVDNEENSYLIKLCGCLALGTIICYYYSLQYIPIQLANVIWYGGFLSVLVLEIYYLREYFTQKELIFAFGAFFGVLLIILNQTYFMTSGEVNIENTNNNTNIVITYNQTEYDSNDTASGLLENITDPYFDDGIPLGGSRLLFTFDDSEESNQTINQDNYNNNETTSLSNTLNTSNTVENSILSSSNESQMITSESSKKEWMMGLIIILSSSIMMASGFIIFNRLKSECYGTLNHIFTMLVVLFLPVFFPMQGVVRPSFFEWIILIIAGFIAEACLLFLIRGLQLEQAGKVSIYFFAQVGLSFLIEMILGSFGGFWGLVGAIIALLSVGLYYKEGRGKIRVRETFVEKEGMELNAF